MRNDTISSRNTEENDIGDAHDGSRNGSVSKLGVRSDAGSHGEHPRNYDGNVSGGSGAGFDDISDGEISVHFDDCTSDGSVFVPDARFCRDRD